MLTLASSTVALALCHRRQDSLGKRGGGGGGRNGNQIKGPLEASAWPPWPRHPASRRGPDQVGLRLLAR